MWVIAFSMDVIKNLFKIVLGVVLIFLVLWLSYKTSWWTAALSLIKGGIVVLVVLIGLVLLLVGFSDLKNAQ